MITAIDTSVLLAIAKGEPEGSAWAEALIRARTEGELVVCDIVAAEFFAAILDRRKLQAFLHGLSIVYSPTTLDSAVLAGRIFRAYLRQGGPRQHLIPDFVVAAHATLQADRFAGLDRGYLRRYFPRLPQLMPG